MDFVFDTPELETERLILRKIRLEDAKDIYHYGAQPEVSKYCIWETHKSVDDALSFINSAILKYENNEPSDWALYHKVDRRVMGAIGYVWVSPENMRCEVGYAISHDYWNKGYTTEALKAFIKYSFDVACLHRIEARCYYENVGSYRVMEKAGMKFEGLLEDQMYVKGDFWSMKLYAIINRK
jgi:[ribosomal protein S5]-alanine N-acetyltransferase